MAQNESNDTIYFMQVLAGIGILGLVVNIVFKNAYFLSMCIIFACMLGALMKLLLLGQIVFINEM